MAATPEEFLREGFLSEPEPLSPSVFLDLPATPHADADADDLVLPYISRMLMEENIDDKFFYQYPDHPALLQAQRPYAHILSSSSDTTTSSDSATNNPSNSALSPSSSSDAANVTWPYDPIELSQLLRSPPYHEMLALGSDFSPNTGIQTSALFLPAHGAATAIHDWDFSHGADEAKTTTTLPDATVDQDVLNSLLLNGGDAFGARSSLPGDNIDMLNQAFLKGMEEARKFLPTNNSLLIDLEASSSSELLPRDNKPVFTGGQVKKEVVDGMFEGTGSGRGRKNRYDGDELEAEVGRSTKLMMPEIDEVGAREMLDEMMMNGYEICLKGMHDLRIVMDSEAEKNIRKGRGKAARGSLRANEVVDLRMMLIHCAQAVATDDRRGATELLKKIRQHASPTGDATQRLAHCFAEGLEARLAGTGSQVYKSLMAKRTSVVELLKAYQLIMAAICFKPLAFKFSNKTIYNAVDGRRKLHIVDFGVHYGFQWPGLLRCLAAREGGPPEVRITAIDLPQPGFRPAAQIEETGCRLSNCAHQFGVPFKFHAIAAKWETVRVEDLNVDPDEVLIVNGLFQFGSLMDESVVVDSPSPRDVVLNNIRKMKPDVFIQCIVNGTYGAPFFVTRFREALFYFSAQFDMLDATTPRDNDQRLLAERDLIGRCVLNIIACEGTDRVERPETYKQWQVRNHRAGLRQLPLNPEIVKIMRDKVKNHFHKDFVIDVDHHWLLEGWKGRILFAMSTWVADDVNSDF